MSGAGYPVCRTCGSNDVLADAYAEWDRVNACWTVLNIYDKGAHCNKCDGETRLEWRRDPPDAASPVDRQPIVFNRREVVPADHVAETTNIKEARHG